MCTANCILDAPIVKEPAEGPREEVREGENVRARNNNKGRPAPKFIKRY